MDVIFCIAYVIECSISPALHRKSRAHRARLAACSIFVLGLVLGGVVLGDDEVQHKDDEEGDHQAAAEDVAQQLGHKLQDLGGCVDAQADGQSDAHELR